MAESEAPAVVDEAALIANAAIDLLVELGGGPVALARLGQLVSKRTQIPIRAALGTKPLSQHLRDVHGDKLLISGDGPSIEVSIASGKAADSRRLYDTAVFSAFSKPLDTENRRWLRSTAPFRFRDAPDKGMLTDDFREVDRKYIVQEPLDKSEKIAAVESAISAWCLEQGIAPELLQRGARIERSEKRPRHEGLEALKAIVAAVPEKERRDVSIGLDLVAKLIGE